MGASTKVRCLLLRYRELVPADNAAFNMFFEKIHPGRAIVASDDQRFGRGWYNVWRDKYGCRPRPRRPRRPIPRPRHHRYHCPHRPRPHRDRYNVSHGTAARARLDELLAMYFTGSVNCSGVDTGGPGVNVAPPDFQWLRDFHSAQGWPAFPPSPHSPQDHHEE